MTQALNLANFANNLNTSGATSNAGLQNSSVTVTAGTGMSGGGSVALGSSITLTNAGVTSFNGSTGAVTFSGGTVSSVATGNGLQGGTITTTGTISLGDVAFNSVGSYAILMKFSTGTIVANSTASGANLGYWSSGTAGGGNTALNAGDFRRSGNVSVPGAGKSGYNSTTAASGSWRCMSGSASAGYNSCDNETSPGSGLWVRIS